jgi:fumarate reductase flavoprotein subunit
MGKVEELTQETIDTEILVMGGGGSGLAAALAAAEKGARVLVIEKRRTPGGNSLRPRGIFAAESHLQKQKKIDALREELIKTAMGYTHWQIDPRIIRAFIYKSADTIRWLEEKGVEFDDVAHWLPNQVPRVFHSIHGTGVKLIKLLVKRCGDLGVRLVYGTAGKKIEINENGHITGALAAIGKRDLKITASSIVIATGGYAGNNDLLRRYYADYTETLYVVGLPHMGDGLLMATEAGAATEGLGTLLLRGPYFRGPLEVVTAAMEPNTVWVNKRGERFTNEAIGFKWPEAANALNRQPDKISYTIFDERIKKQFMEDGIIKGYNRFPPQTKLTQLGLKLEQQDTKGKVKIGTSWKQIAEWMGASPKALKATIDEYNRFCKEKYDELFFKEQRFLQPLREPPYYAIKCYQGVYNTIGGIKINEHMEVLDQDDRPIPGLYAAGTDAGGWESHTYCLTLSGNAFGFAVNSGRIAGENAAKYTAERQIV